MTYTKDNNIYIHIFIYIYNDRCRVEGKRREEKKRAKSRGNQFVLHQETWLIGKQKLPLMIRGIGWTMHEGRILYTRTHRSECIE